MGETYATVLRCSEVLGSSSSIATLSGLGATEDTFPWLPELLCSEVLICSSSPGLGDVNASVWLCPSKRPCFDEFLWLTVEEFSETGEVGDATSTNRSVILSTTWPLYDSVVVVSGMTSGVGERAGVVTFLRVSWYTWLVLLVPGRLLFESLECFK